MFILYLTLGEMEVKQFLSDVKIRPKIISTDFAQKIIVGKVAALIEEDEQIDIQAAPLKQQHQNGLVEQS